MLGVPYSDKRDTTERVFRAVKYDPTNPEDSVQALKQATVALLAVHRSWYEDKASKRRARVFLWFKLPIIIFSGIGGLLLSVSALNANLAADLLIAFVAATQCAIAPLVSLFTDAALAPCSDAWAMFETDPPPSWTNEAGSIGSIAALVAGGIFAADRFLLMSSQYTVWRLIECRLAVRIAELGQDLDAVPGIVDDPRVNEQTFAVMRNICHKCIIDVLEEIQRET
jgi:hypothetical protein